MKTTKRVIDNKKAAKTVFVIKKREPTKKEKLAAARRVRGLWACKDTSFFDQE
ncbi:hypothetical protein SDD30_08190 [Moorella naiadis]|uniref:hypothetical protein n=1 Tax=Moorella naiadis (nom. illeg.) TaxID=3093670 RepID=UPI003D9CB925